MLQFETNFKNKFKTISVIHNLNQDKIM